MAQEVIALKREENAMILEREWEFRLLPIPARRS